MTSAAAGDELHNLWRCVRSPFYRIHCEAHEWETYDCDRAGCVKCGAAHHCKGNMVDNKTCPLFQNEDGSVCCMVTGMCIPMVRYSADEFVDTAAVPDGLSTDRVSVAENTLNLYEDVHRIVYWFLCEQSSVESRQEEADRYVQKIRANVIAKLKDHKRDYPSELPCLPDVIAHSMHMVPVRRISHASPELCALCAERITRCLVDLGLTSAHAKRRDIVVGALYLMKSGLQVKNSLWLPMISSLRNVLPHESSLGKTFELSTKIICSTENELKLALRHRERML